VHFLLPAPQTLYKTEHERLEQAMTRSGFWGCGFCKSVAAAHKSGSDLTDLAQLQLQSVQPASASLGVFCTIFELLGAIDQGM
jgi:hypothetical protein